MVDLIHSNLSEYFTTHSLDGNHHYTTFINNFTHFTNIYLSKHKSNTTNTIKDFCQMVKTQFDTTIKKFYTDNTGRYVNKEREKY